MGNSSGTPGTTQGIAPQDSDTGREEVTAARRKPARPATDSLAGWLSARTDAQLVALLQLRPDLAVPLPSSMTVLGARAEQRASVLRASEDLDTLEFAVVETLTVH